MKPRIRSSRAEFPDIYIMSKVRYNILRFALGLFVGVLSLRAIRDFNALSISELVALAFGIFASVVHYLPEKQDTNNTDRG